MTPEELKAIERRIYEEGWNRANLAVFDELCAPNFVMHSPQYPDVRTLEEYKKLVARLHESSPDTHFSVEDMIAAGDEVVTRFSFRGTNLGDATTVAGTPPTGKVIRNTGISITRYVGGKAVEEWLESDALGVVKQLGYVLRRE